MKYLLLFAILQAACHRAPGLPPVTPEAYRTLGDGCTPGDPVSCPRDLFLRGLEEASEAYVIAETCRVDLNESREFNSIDQAVAAGRLQECEARASQRWLWGVAGLATGALTVGLIFLLAGGKGG